MRDLLNSFFSLTRRPQSHRRGRVRIDGNTAGAACRGCSSSELLEDRTLLATQLILSDAPSKDLSAGQTVDIPVYYQTLNDSGSAAALRASLLSFNLHFDADALTFVQTTSIFSESLQVSPNATRGESDAAVTGDDNDSDTETVLLARYQDADATPGWPNSPSVNEQLLYIARFMAKPGFRGTTVRFSANATGAVVGGSGNFTFDSFSLELQAPTGLTVSIANAPPVAEGGNAAFPVTLSQASTTPVTVTWSTSEGDGPTGALGGEDFVVRTNQTLTFNPGETQKTISIATVADSAIEPTEEFGVSLLSITGASFGATQATGFITDDDASLPTLSIEDANVATEGSVATFTVRLSAAAANTVTVQYSTADGDGPTGAINGVDITSQTNQTLTFNAGQTQKTITVATVDDAIAEPAENFVVKLFNSSGAAIARGEALGTINDNDVVLPSLSIANAASVTEGGTAVFTVTLNAASANDVTVKYSTSTDVSPTGAIDGVDYIAQTNITLTFAPGQTQKTINISTTDDSLAEPTETFLVTLSNAAGANLSNAQATGTIIDNDSGSQNAGNIDGDSDFDANDSFLIQLVKLSGTDAQINQSKGSSPLTATQIRANINQLGLVADVDGDQDFDANDAFLIHLVKLSGTNAQIDQSKGSSALTAAQIRTNVNSLGSSSGFSASSQRLLPVLSSAGVGNGNASKLKSPQQELFAADEPGDQPAVTHSLNVVQTGDDSVAIWDGFRDWIDAI